MSRLAESCLEMLFLWIQALVNVPNTPYDDVFRLGYFGGDWCFLVCSMRVEHKQQISLSWVMEHLLSLTLLSCQNSQMSLEEFRVYFQLGTTYWSGIKNSNVIRYLLYTQRDSDDILDSVCVFFVRGFVSLSSLFSIGISHKYLTMHEPEPQIGSCCTQMHVDCGLCRVMSWKWPLVTLGYLLPKGYVCWGGRNPRNHYPWPW